MIRAGWFPAGAAGSGLVAALLLSAMACATPGPNSAAPRESRVSGIGAAESSLSPTPAKTHGFHGMAFGTALSSVKHEMKLLARKGKWQFHSRHHENLSLGEAELTAVHYGFYRGKLLSVTVYAKGEENAIKLLAWLERNYGAAKSGNAGRKFWADEHVRAIYEFDSAIQTAFLSVSSRKLLQVKELTEEN